MANTYLNGQGALLRAIFADVAGAAADPTTVTLKVNVNGITTTYTFSNAGGPGLPGPAPGSPIVRTGVGLYQALIATALGQLTAITWYDWLGLGGGAGINTVGENYLLGTPL